MTANIWANLFFTQNKKLEQILGCQGSLTKYLQQNFSDFSVQVIEERDGQPFEDERAILTLAPSESVKIRSVYLCSQQKPLVYARTTVPTSLWFDERTKLYQLGNVPLGKILFDEKNPAKRHEFQFAWLNQDYFSNYSIRPSAEYFQSGLLPARRSVFSWYEQGLLVTEVFLPEFSSSLG